MHVYTYRYTQTYTHTIRNILFPNMLGDSQLVGSAGRVSHKMCHKHSPEESRKEGRRAALKGFTPNVWQAIS